MHTYDAMHDLTHQHQADLLARAEAHRAARSARRGRRRGSRLSVAVTLGRRAPRDGLVAAIT